MQEGSIPTSESSKQNTVRIEPWDESDLLLLKKLLGDPAMTEHLGGPESDEQLAERHARYLRLADTGRDRMFKIIHEATGEAIGSVGYWERNWQGEQVYETGWSVLLAFQGRGIARAATAQALGHARLDGLHRYVHAFPSVDNPPSNAICRKLGFTLVEECEFEYPKGHFMRCNDWRLDLFARNERAKEKEHIMEDDRHAIHARRLIEAVLTTESETDPSLRRAVESLAAQMGGRPSLQSDMIPPELINYVKKVALHAYKTTDEDIEALRQAGYSEDAIFEITLSAALGAGMARLERGLASLKEND